MNSVKVGHIRSVNGYNDPFIVLSIENGLVEIQYIKVLKNEGTYKYSLDALINKSYIVVDIDKELEKL